MKWQEKVRQLKTEVYVLYLALKDRRTPWYAKALSAVVVAYALSPVDLIPDFIPVLGYIDDLILIPAGIYLTFKLIPDDILEEHRQKAKTASFNSRTKWVAAAIVVLIWLLVLYLIIKAIWL
jgi:uncharacterized membrane protein YkvA (DUF1232 family)